MYEQYKHLVQLIIMIHECNTYKSSSELNLILSKYISVLNYINGYNEAYKSATNIYFTDITDIRDCIQQSLVSTNASEKINAFETAKTQLKKDLSALATLIQPREEVIHAIA